MAAPSALQPPSRSRSRTESPGALSLYLHEIESIPVLEADEERRLAVKAARGDRLALEKLVHHNLRFVVKVARQYAQNGVPLEDLISEGNIGLVVAARRFDPSRGCRLISYASWWIRRYILAYLTDRSRMVRIPEDKVSELRRLGRATEMLIQQNGREPTAEELAEPTDLSEREIEILQSLPRATYSLDAPSDMEGSEFVLENIEDTSAADIEEVLTETLRSADIEAAVDELDPRESEILRRHFGLTEGHPESLKSIGLDYGVSRERVRQLKERALSKIRRSRYGKVLREYCA